MYESRLEQVLKETGERERLWEAGETLLVAVSGGPDSMAMLFALHRLSTELGITVTAAHLNHGFRGEESEKEAEGVAAFAHNLGIPCRLHYVNMPDFIEESGMNAQAAARLKRYDFLREAASSFNASKIVLAHHADDQAETVLMRLLRGASIGSLSGMPIRRWEKNMELIRPMLRMYKADIIHYCKEHSIPYYQDSSNKKRNYFRNEIRLDVIPYLEVFNEQLPQALSRLAELATAEDDFMQWNTEAVYASLVTAGERGLEVSVSAFAELHLALQRRLIKLILTYLVVKMESIPFERIEAIRLAALADAPSTWRTDVGSGVVFVREYGKMLFSAKGQPEEKAYYSYEAPGTGKLPIPESGQVFCFERLSVQQVSRSADNEEAVFDADALVFPLHMRNRRSGDRMSILGLNGSKKVQDIFVDAKIAPSVRNRLPILIDGNGELLWVPGVRRSNHALSTLHTQSCLKITVKDMGAAGHSVSEHKRIECE